jgi:hypothetical protein
MLPFGTANFTVGIWIIEHTCYRIYIYRNS